MQILNGLWTTPQGEPFSFEGRFWQLEECPQLPSARASAAARSRLGGTGPRRTPPMAAKLGRRVQQRRLALTAAERFANVRRVCEEIGRDPSTLRMSATAQVICGSTRAEAQERLERLGEPGAPMLANGVVGTPSEVVGELERLDAEGCETVYLHIFDIDDLDHLAADRQRGPCRRSHESDVHDQTRGAALRWRA